MYYSISFRDSMPWCVYFGRYRQKKHWEHRGKKIPFHLLVYVIGGSATFRYSDRSYEVKTGDWLLIPRDTFYTADTEDFCDYYYFHFTADITCCGETLPENKNGWGYGYSCEPVEKAAEFSSSCCLTDLVHFPEHSTVMLPLCVKLHDRLYRLQPEAEYDFQLIFGQILLELSKLLRNSATSSSAFLVNRIAYYIHENVSEAVTLTDLAEHFGLSKSYILKLFRQNFNTTVTVYINNVKLDHAAQLLITSMMNINEISEFLGYSDPAYFSRLFKRRFGVSPSKYTQYDIATHRDPGGTHNK